MQVHYLCSSVVTWKLRSKLCSGKNYLVSKPFWALSYFSEALSIQPQEFQPQEKTFQCLCMLGSPYSVTNRMNTLKSKPLMAAKKKHLSKFQPLQQFELIWSLLKYLIETVSPQYPTPLLLHPCFLPLARTGQSTGELPSWQKKELSTYRLHKDKPKQKTPNTWTVAHHVDGAEPSEKKKLCLGVFSCNEGNFYSLW